MPSLHRLSVVIPTLNEAANIESLVRRCHQALSRAGIDFELIVVDDGSPDGTADIATAMVPQYPQVRVIRRTAKPDLAGAVLDGWAAAKGDLLAVIDGDLQHPPEQLVKLYLALEESGADIAVASRHIRGGGVSEWALQRRVVSWGAALLASYLLPGLLNTVRDPMSGYFLLRKQVLDGIELKPRGYKILVEVLVRARYSQLVEVPYVFEERKEGASKLGQKQAIDFLLHMATLSWRTGEFSRIVSYGAVGIFGVLVNYLTAVALLRASVTYDWVSLVLAFQASIFSNGLLNETVTFRDSVSGGSWGERAKRFVVFEWVSMTGLLANLTTVVMVSAAGASSPVAAGSGLVVGGLVNFFLNTHVTWKIFKQTRIARENPGERPAVQAAVQRTT